MSTKTYDPLEISCVFLGIPISGFANGTFVEAERNEDTFTLTVGASGEGARARNRNKSGQVTFTLLATSSSNDLLAAVAAADELNGTGSGPLFIKDRLGTTVAVAANAWVKKQPKIEYGKEVSDRQWVIECEALEIFSGGTT